MGLYLNMVSENGEKVIDNVKLLFVGNIFTELLREKEVLGEYEDMEIDKEYELDIQDFHKIIKHYKDLIGDYEDYEFNGQVGVIRHMIIEPIQQQLDFQITEHKSYIVSIS